MTQNDWSDPHLRGVKRSLSVYEKSSLLNTRGRALIMPSEPPRKEGELGEVEELRAAGFDPHYIYGVEHDKDLAVKLYEHYYDSVQIHHEEIGEFLWKSRGGFSYVHFDFCGQLGRAAVDTVQSWMGKVLPLSRVRVSVEIGRRAPAQREFESMLRNTILHQLIKECAKIDVVAPDRWADRFWPQIEEAEDTTHIIATLMLLNFFFDVNCWSWGDSNQIAPQLPTVRGKHSLSSMSRFTYREVGGPTKMATVWADLVPFDAQQVANNAQWIVNEVANFFEAILAPIGQFIPELYMEESS